MNPAVVLIVLLSYLIAFIAALYLFSRPAHAYAPATDPLPIDETRPLMDCWITEDGGNDCRLVRG